MNKIKIFLGAACLVIAVAAAAATKVKDRAVTYFYYETATTCSSITLPSSNCTLGTSGCTYNVPDIGVKQLYATRSTASQCANPLKN